MSDNPPPFHPNAPKRLIFAFRKVGTFRGVARECGVNVKFVHDLLVHGKEPSDHNPTVRIALFLPKRHRHKKPPWLKEAVRNLIELRRKKENSPVYSSERRKIYTP